MFKVVSRQLDRVRIARDLRRYSWADVQVGLVVSTGRTGTNFVQALLTKILTAVDARHEPRPDLFDLGTRRMRGEIADAFAAHQLQVQRIAIRKDLAKKGIHRYIESNNNLAYLLPQISACWPTARIVHIIRDGRDFVRSSFSKKVISKSTNKLDALFMTDDDKRRRLQASDLRDDPYFATWSDMSRFERLTWYWMKKDHQICNDLAGRSDVLRVRFEDLFDAELGVDWVLKIIDHLNMIGALSVDPLVIRSMMNERINETSGYLLPPWSEWTTEQQSQFDKIAGGHMKRLGYTD